MKWLLPTSSSPTGPRSPTNANWVVLSIPITAAIVTVVTEEGSLMTERRLCVPHKKSLSKHRASNLGLCLYSVSTPRLSALWSGHHHSLATTFYVHIRGNNLGMFVFENTLNEGSPDADLARWALCPGRGQSSYIPWNSKSLLGA